MKRKFLFELLVISIIASLIFLSSCVNEHIHEFGEWSVITEAKCETDGEHIRNCKCGEKETESIPAIGHNYSDGVCINCNAYESSPDEYFIFTELEDGTYSIKVADHYTISGRIVVPSEYNNKPVTKIETGGFGFCAKITEIIIPESIKLIDTVAFSGCSSLVKITLPEGITEIPTACFADCRELVEIVLPDGITKIGHSAFINCKKLKSVIIGEGLKIIDDWAFKRCLSLESINIPDGTESIGMLCFESASLREIRIPDSVRVIGDEAFFGIYMLQKVYLGSGITQICNKAFYLCPNISDVYFSGNEENWTNIIMRGGNEDLTSATLHLVFKDE